MRILQISDFHLRGDGKLSFQVVDTAAFLERTVSHLKHVFSLKNQAPDIIVVTGDIADSGDEHAYRMVYEALSGFGVPVYAVPGNHDRRDRMKKLLSGWTVENPETAPFLSYAVDFKGTRMLFLDSMEPGSHSGHVSEVTVRWLEKELKAHPQVPTLVFMHHPPFITGMGAMDEPYENREVLRSVLEKAPWVRLCCGHMHRPIFTVWAGVPCVTAPAASMQIELDFSAGGGDTFRMETSGYLLHDFEEGAWNTHVCQIYSPAKFDGPYPFVGKVNPVED
jgi:3',5'-cyclic-AMP phosphodiesterase